MDLHSSEARLTFLLRLSDALRPLDDAAEIQVVATRILGEELGANRVGYAEDLSTDGEIVVKHDWTSGVASIAGRHRLDDFGENLLPRLRVGKIDAYADIANDAELGDAAKRAYADLGIGAMVSVPLTSAGDLRAIFFLHYREAHDFDAREIEFLRETAERTWLAIERARAHAALHKSEARLAAALESVPVGVGVIDTGGRIVIANSEYRQFLPNGIIPSRDPASVSRWRGWGESGLALAPREFPGARAMRGERVVPGQAMLFTDGDGCEVWTRVASVPIYGTDGVIAGQASAISDINALKRGAEALRESKVRAEFLIDGIAQATWEAAASGDVEADSPSWRAYTGQSFEQWRGCGWLDALHPDDRTSTLRTWRDAVEGRLMVDAEYRLRAADGSYRWMNVRAVPLLNAAGQVEKWLGMNIDIDERKRLEQSLRDSERRTRALMEGVPQLLWRADRAGQWRWTSPQWTAFTGQSEEESRGMGWLARLHPDDRTGTLAAWAQAEATGSIEVEHRLRSSDGNYRWFSTCAVPIRGEDGATVEWLGTANDIDALRQAQERQGVMVAELQHRTRNLIAVVQSLSEKTIDGASSLEEFEQRFHDRLSALARVQGLLSHATAGRRVTFDELLCSELLALGVLDKDGQGDRVVLTGPHDVPLRSRGVQTLALALHELATNAVKHGAFATGTGYLTVTWQVEMRDDIPTLCIEWCEHGVTLPHIDIRSATRGYGRELIERALPYQLDAETGYAFTDDGLCCTIELPIVSTQVGEEEN